MAKKTVINRALKTFVNSSSDASVLADAYNRTTANDYQRDDPEKVIDVEEEELKASAAAAIFGTPAPADPAEEEPDTSGLTAEEKEAIIAAEIAEAEAEAGKEAE